ncbi:uncharacterized protein LOC107044080 [Diachasma alloeum]|uniref:uncharacterized protein LOC107044080 n=1 Tax=Diachasma alloeum TaxID=454923 RepID=UPI0007382A34|nr:uncharacterized protein LOC107044080 [Diachasma alloeum]XP_015121314.1 uncharacterized protein LOC107044080 [Diachasma alloeum]XP_015121315.1 uncharacterized protein LOC107044080 [Diachasma alloeum]
MMQALGAMEQTVGWAAEDVPGCNDLQSLLVSIKRTSTSIESDLDSGYQDVCLDNHSATPATSKDSQESDADSTDKDTNSDTESMRQAKDRRIHDESADENVKQLLSAANEVNLLPNWSELEKKERLEVVNGYIRQYFPNVPESLVANCSGSLLIPDDSGNLPSEVPDWLDKEKFARGQCLARKNIFGIFFSNGLALYTLYSFEDGLKPVIMTGRSSDPYTSFKRFLSTANRIRNWFTTDPWTKGTPAYNDMQVVRSLHTSVRNTLQKMSVSEIDRLAKIKDPMAVRTDLLLKDFRASCPAPKVGQCPYAIPEMKGKRSRGLSQGEMGLTMFGFVGLPILFPEAFGIHYASEKDLDDFCHLWRGLGYLLGICDEFNFCRGGLKETRQRSRDFLDFWVKPNLREFRPELEHMMRCVYEGLHLYLPGSSYDSALLYLADLMGLHMPRLRASMSYSSWFRYYLSKTLFYYLFKFNWIKLRLNRRLNTVIDRACAFNEEKHAELRKKSNEIVSAVLKNSHDDKSGDSYSTNL